MEEDASVKSTVTRLRRRLSSVEQSDDVKSPSAQNTPTKKRVGRPTAKPQLDLIDENVPVSSPKKTTRRSVAKELSELIISTHTTKTCESPRAIRAARRHSQGASVNESNISITSTRQTRRTRRDSASTIDNQAEYTSKLIKDSNPIIVEEPDNSSQKSTSNSETTDTVQTDNTPVTRKSPRIANKDTKNNHHDDDDSQDCYLCRNISTETEKSLSKSAKSPLTTIKEVKIILNTLPENKCNSMRNFGITDIDKSFNNSTNEDKFPTESDKLHDRRESHKENIHEDSHHSSVTLKVVEKAPEGDIQSTTIVEDYEGPQECQNINETIKLFETAPVGNVQSTIIVEDSDSEIAVKQNTNKQPNNEDQCVPVVDHQEISAFNQQEQNNDESHKESLRNKSLNDSKRKRQSTSSGCSRIVKATNDSCEPMDIDESMPNSVHIADFSKNDLENSLKDMSVALQDNSKLSISQLNESVTSNKSSEKSQHLGKVKNETLCILQVENGEANETFHTNIIEPPLIIQDLKKSGNETKNTLTLSQIKDDVSYTDNNLTTSPKVYKAEVLSSSVNIPEATTENEASKKNISLKELSGTPFKQKNVQKLGMQTSTPVIIVNDESHKNTIKLSKVTSKPKKSSKTSVASRNRSQINSDTEDESEDESTKDLSKMMIDDQAQEASDDYESGDSQDEEEKQNELENEILEKGETLTSEEDLSEDTDYEKDSFVITSDEECNELLSGTGDDLSMGEDELTMSAKSKKKFNERKRKQQKEASREMFESRHKLKVPMTTSDTSKLKKNNRRRLDSSILESEDDTVDRPKRKNRMRLDSSHDNSVIKSDVDESISTKKSKVKQLSKSLCEDNEIQEKETAIVCEESMMAKSDPLATDIKQEPKTPQKDPNISALNFTVRVEVEELTVDENVSVIRENESVDPLQATTNVEDVSSSENEEIVQNYESILKDLNKAQDKKTHLLDISLNFNKKSKEKKRESIIDKLNLTQTEHPKKNKSISENVNVKELIIISKNEEICIKEINNQEIHSDKEDSSDSIDIQLLFSENNNDNEETEKNKETEAADVILSKRNESKTDITAENADKLDNENWFNVSATKISKNPKLSIGQSEVAVSPKINEAVAISTNTGSVKKQIKKNKSITIDTTTEDIELENACEVVQNISMRSAKEHRKKTKSGSSVIIDTITHDDKESDDATEVTDDISLHTPKKQKKNTKAVSPIDDTAAQDLELSVGVTPNDSMGTSKKRRKKKRNSESSTVDITVDDNNLENAANDTQSSSKKHKKKTELSADDNTPQDNKVSDVDIVTEATCDTSLERSKKHKKKPKSILPSTDTTTQQESRELIEETELTHHLSFGKSKKHKKSKSDSTMDSTTSHVTDVDNVAEAACDSSIDNSKIHKKKLKSKLASNDTTTQQELQETTEGMEVTHDLSLGKFKKHKKKAKSEETSVEATTLHVTENVQSSKKRKHSLSNTTLEDIVKDTSNDVDTSKTVKELLDITNKKKKRKISHRDENTDGEFSHNQHAEPEQTTDKKMKKKYKNNNNIQEATKTDGEISNNQLGEQEQTTDKKMKKKNKHTNYDDTQVDTEPGPSVKTSRKRKQREDDVHGGGKKPKIPKEDSYDTVLPQLPASILSQLEDKPRKKIDIKRTTVVATTEFIVEDNKKTKKNKPSNYLEESVYLNLSPVKKQKSHLNKPKVLPFIPTASTSNSGYTNNFRVEILPQNIQFVAQSNDIVNFKNEYLNKKNIKKFGTYDLYKKTRNVKLSKF